MKKVIENKQYSLNWRDILKGLLIAVITPVFFIIQQTLEKGELSFDWKSIGIAAVSGGLAYLAKNFFEPSRIIEVIKK